MRIPLNVSDGDALFYERVKPQYVVKAQVGTSEIAVLYEEPRTGFTYGCTPKDVIHVLSLLPDDDVCMIDTVVFRQPSRKQAQQAPVWGRLHYLAVLGSFVGPCIYVEAFEIGSSFRWPRKLSLDRMAELGRLRADGHFFEENKREYIITPTADSIRNTILYRTPLHEVGHWVQYEKEALDEGSALDANSDVAYDLYFAKPTAERESFAHRYAGEQGDRLRKSGSIPFRTLG